MKWIYCPGKEKTAARYEYRARGLTLPGRKRPSSRLTAKPLRYKNILLSFQRALLRFGQRRENLVVFTPRHFPLLARSQNTGAQTIPFKDEGLYLKVLGSNHE